jgi:transposase-like protein
MPDKTNDTVIATVMEQLMAEGPQAMAQIITALMNLAMRMEREQFLGAGHYERAVDRRGYANGIKPKLIDTLAGTLSLEVPKTAGTDEPYYPQALERGRRSCRAVMLAVAEMYVCGVSTRDAERVMAEFGLKSLSSTQVSRAAKLLDEELEAWRRRQLGEIHYLFLDARYEKSRQGGVVRDAAVLSAVGVGPDGRRRVLGVSAALSEAEVHWRAFLEDLVGRGMRGVRFIASDDHAGLEAARKAVLGGAVWQRCQFHLAQNAIHHAPTAAIRKRIGSQLREIWNAKNLAGAEAELKALVEAYRNRAPELAAWLEVAIPEGLAVFTLPEHHRKRMRTSNPIERAVQQELKRRTVKVRVFPNNASLLRLVTAVLVEIDETWQASTQPYINWNTPDA